MKVVLQVVCQYYHGIYSVNKVLKPLLFTNKNIGANSETLCYIFEVAGVRQGRQDKEDRASIMNPNYQNANKSREQQFESKEHEPVIIYSKQTAPNTETLLKMLH